MIYDLRLQFLKISKKLQFFTIQVKDTQLGMMVSHLVSTVSAFIKIAYTECRTDRIEI